MRLPWTQLSASPRTVLFRWKSVVDHIDHAVRRAPRRWTTTRPRKGTMRSRATGGRSRRHDRRCFGWLEKEDQRLKKHYGRWMDIVQSLELESFILTKLTKPSVPVNLVGPQVILPLWWVPAVRGRIIFFAKYSGPSGGSPLSGGGIIILRVIRRHFLAAAVDLAVSLSTYSPRPMEVVPCPR